MDWILNLIESQLCRWSARAPIAAPVAASASTESLGTVRDTDDPFDMPAGSLLRHAYLLGSTGCGKTSLILRLLKRDLLSGHSAAVIDLRGDLVNGALALCVACGVPAERVKLLDLRESDRVQPFNPLAGAGEPYFRALHVLDVVAKEADSWGVQLEETLRNALLLLAAGGGNLTDLDRLFSEAGFRSKLAASATDPALRAFWQRYESLGPDKRAAWTLPVLNKVSSLTAVPVLRSVLGGEPSLDLGRTLSQPGSVFLVSLAVDELHRSARMLGSLMVSAIAREMMARVNLPEKDRNPVRLYVDEFENMAGEPFEGLIAEGRRFGLTLVLSHQTLAQLPARLRSVVRNNVGVQVLFQCGFEDAAAVAREIGGVSPADVRDQGVGEAFVTRRGHEPCRVKFAKPLALPGPKAVEAYRSEVMALLPPSRKPAPAPAPPAGPVPQAAPDVEDWL